MIGHRFAISYLLRWFRTLPWNVFICFLIELSSTFLAMQCNAKQTLHRLVILRFFPITSLLACSPWGFLFFASSIGKASKKNRIFYGQADRKRFPHPPSKGQLFMNFLVRFYFRVWLYVFWNGFYTRKVTFIQLQNFPTPLYCCYCCSVTKQSDSDIAEALKL